MTSPQPQNGTVGASLRSLWTKVSAVPGDATSDRPSTSYAGHSSPPVRRHSRLVGSVGRSLQDLVSFLDEVHGAGVWRVWRVRTRDDRGASSCCHRQSSRTGQQKREGHRTTEGASGEDRCYTGCARRRGRHSQGGPRCWIENWHHAPDSAGDARGLKPSAGSSGVGSAGRIALGSVAAYSQP
jgi:hypothetical protein